MRRVFTFLALSLIVLHAAANGSVNVRLTGIESGDKIALTISSSSYLASMQLTADGDYRFENVPEGTHFVKAEASGYNVMEALSVIVGADGSVVPATPLRIAVTKQNENPDRWEFSWKEDESPAGYTTSSYINTPPEIEFLGKKIVPADVPSANILQSNYNVILSNENEIWTQEYAYRMVETLKTLPTKFDKKAKFILTSGSIKGDIEISDLGEAYEVTISNNVFYYANPFLVNLDGVRGRLFSKRLHHALTEFATDFGNDVNRADEILWNRFGCHILGVDYESLTKGITDEDAGRFQMFAPTEIVNIINMFEEMPEGFHKIPHLNYLIRRVNGMKHPLYPEAAAVTWPVENGYIEFMETAFTGGGNDFETLRLIIHEKTHMLWEFTFSEQLKNDWIELGGWYKDPNASAGWSTTKDVEFVSAYAHAINPNEDMAESVAFYLKDPEKLMSRSLPKYEFIRDRIMHGTRYISSIPDNLTFEVLNLFPDYDYPGKINHVGITVDGAPEEDKILTIEVGLNHMDGFNDAASHGLTRVTSPVFYDKDGKAHSQFVDVHLDPTDDGYTLRGSANIGKYAKAGHWSTGDIILSDLQGNERYEGRNDCVTDVYVNNPLEDLFPPEYVSGSLEYELTDIMVDGHECQNLKVTYKVTDNIGISLTFSRLYADVEGFNGGGTSLTDKYGTYDPETQTAEINFIIPDYYPTADYYLPFVNFRDLAGTGTEINFTDSPLDEPIKKIFIKTPDPDTKAPEIDLNRIVVYAEPTHPEAPDGETKVTVNFYARDDNSGFGPCYYHFRDPQGVLHGNYWYYHRNFYTNFFDGDPTVWENYKITHILPQGSAPGIWGLAQMYVSDKAGNKYTYNFVETLIFEPDESGTDYVLFSELDENNMLTIDLKNEGESFGFTWRVIHEESGEEINGASDAETAAAASRAGFSTLSSRRGTSVDVSALSDGELIVIVCALDEAGTVECVKTSRVTKKTTTGITAPAEFDAKTPVSVYNLQGVILKRNVTIENWADGLPSGIYIRQQGNKSIKIRIK